MIRPLQPQFKIRVFNGKRVALETLKDSKVQTGDNFIDIESCCAFPVTYEESADLLTHLNFTVDKYADILLYYFYIGQSVTLSGGYYADDQAGMRHIFSGTVTRIRTSFTDSGHVSFSVECMNYGFTKLGKDYKNFVYPDKKSKRKGADKDTMSVTDIVKCIAEDNNFEIGEISMKSGAKSVNFDKVNVRYQKNMTDWQFLTKLAQDFGCSVWISTEDGVEKLYFVSHETAFKKQSSDISFLYPLNGRIKDVTEREMQRFSDSQYDRPRILKELSVDEDIASAYSVSRSAMYYDKDTGDYKQSIMQITEDEKGNRHVYFLELDEQKVAQVRKEHPEIAESIMYGGPTNMQWGTPDDPKCAAYYYKKIEYYENFNEQAVFDKTFFGITITAKCNQDLDIHSQRTYRIRGILSYHSKDLESSYFLRGLKHVWDADGNWTELDFIR